jgi:hypothetical protein
MVAAYNRTTHEGKLVHVGAYDNHRLRAMAADPQNRESSRAVERSKFLQAHGEVMIKAEHLPHMHDYMAILHRSAKQPGKWQLTYLHMVEPSLPNIDVISDSYEDLLKELQSDGVILMNTETVPIPKFSKALRALRYCFGRI